MKMAIKESDDALSLDDEYHIDFEIRNTARIIIIKIITMKKMSAKVDTFYFLMAQIY
jgi:hypothetical protein